MLGRLLAEFPLSRQPSGLGANLVAPATPPPSLSGESGSGGDAPATQLPNTVGATLDPQVALLHPLLRLTWSPHLYISPSG
jgi:hypothetical protein